MTGTLTEFVHIVPSQWITRASFFERTANMRSDSINIVIDELFVVGLLRWVMQVDNTQTMKINPNCLTF